MTKKVKRNIASLLLATQLFFSLFAPFIPFVASPAWASDDDQSQSLTLTRLEFDSQENGVDNQLHIQVSGSASETLPYNIFYLYEGLTQSIQGELISGSENVIFIGTQSGDDFINHDWQRMILKVEVDGVIRSYRLENQVDSQEVLGSNEVADDLELSFAESQWLIWTVDSDSKTAVTHQDVVLYHEYAFPLNDKVSVTFTRLPEETSPLTIRKVVLSEELAKKYGTDVAFDITTEMENGEFEFDLSLPKSEVVEGDEVEVLFADSEDDLADDTKVRRVETERDGEQLVEVDEEAGVVKARKVEHMTVFVVSTTLLDATTTSTCVDSGATEESGCFATIQGAINAASDGDVVQVYPGTYVESVTINVPNLTLESIEGRDGTTIDNPNVGSETAGISVVANMGTVTVDGFTVNNFRNGIIQGMASAEGTTFFVRNNKIIPENNETNPYLRNGIQVTGNGSEVIGNYIIGAPLTPEWAGSGIGVINASNVLVRENTINTGDANYIGINVDNWSVDLVENVVIRENEISTGSGRGVDISGYYWAEPRKEVKNIQVLDNNINSNRRGINIQTVQLDGFLIANNDFINSSEYAIRLSSSAFLSGILQINNNLLKDSVLYELVNTSATDIDATNNNWDTIDFSEIERKVYHKIDNDAYGFVDFTSPIGLNDDYDQVKTANINQSSTTDIQVGDLRLVSPQTVTGVGTVAISKYGGLPDKGALSFGVDGYYYNIQYTGDLKFPLTIELSYDESSFNEDKFVSLYYFDGAEWKDYQKDNPASTVSIDKENNVITANLQHLTPIVPGVDETDPVVELTSIEKGKYYRDTIDFRGTSVEENPESYRFYLRYLPKEGGKLSVYNSGWVPLDKDFTDETLYEWDSTTSPFGDGTYRVRFDVRDRAGNWKHDLVDIEIDNTAPSVNDVNLNNETVESTDIRSNNCEAIQKFYPVSGEIDFSAIIEDNLSGVDVVRFNIRKVGSNGCTHSSVYRSKNVTMTKGDDGRWSGKFDTTNIPNDGEYTIQLTAKDNSGNETIKYVDILVDNTAPEINITPSRQPDVGKWYSTRPSYSNTHPTIELSTNEETTIEYKWDGASDWEVYSSVINTSVLTNGEHTLYVKATDLAGNPNTAEFTIWLDFSNPEGEMSIEETNGFVSDDMTINFSNVHDPSGSEEISRIEIWIDGHGYQGSAEDLSEGNYRFIFDTTTLIDGVYTARPSIFDKAGNRTRPSAQFTVDNTPPSSTITNPEGDTWHNGPITIEGNTTDENGIVEVLLSAALFDVDTDTCGEYSEITTLNSDPAQSDFTWSYDWTPSAEESYCIKAQGTDVAGNPETTAVVQNIIYDITIPEIGVTIDPEDADGSGNWYITRPEVTLSPSDNFEVDYVEYRWGKTGSWTTYSSPLKSPSEGTNTLYYRAFDMAGNVSSDEGVKTLQWDQTDLTQGPFNVSADPNPTSGSTSSISWDKATDNIGIAHYKVTWDLRDGDDKHSKNVSSDTIETTIRDLQEGVYKVTVTAFDHAGHSKSASIDLIINRTAPAAPTLTLESTGEGTATLSWNEVEDATDYIILYGVESGAYIYAARVGDVTNYTVEGLTTGNYYFVVRAIDNVDNQSSNSNEVSTGDILGAALGTGTGGPAVGFQEVGDVLGDQTDQEPTAEEMEQALLEAEQDGRVQGAAIDCSGWKINLPWIVLGLQLALLFAVEILLRQDSSAVKQVITLGITITAVASYYLLRNSDCFAPSSINMLVNKGFWLISIVISAATRVLGYGFIEVVEK